MPLDIIRNDITRVTADAIVNTANPHVAVGPGTDRAVYEAAGAEKLLEARARIGEMKPGQAAYTPAFALDADYIIHTVGPAWRGGRFHERETAAECYRSSLKLAADLGCESVAFPLISSGSYGFPKDEALKIAIREISSFLMEHDMNVTLVVYDRESFVMSGKAFAGVRSYIEEHEIRPPEPRMNRRFREYTGSLNAEDLSGSDSSADYMYSDEAVIPEESEILMMPEASAPYEAPDLMYRKDSAAAQKAEAPKKKSRLRRPKKEKTLRELTLEQIMKIRGETFQQMLLRTIDGKGMTDPEVYKRSNIDRKLFSKIRSDVNYNPSKRTVMALAVGLRLNYDEAVDLLQKAGYSFSPSSVTDLTVRYCIENDIYDIHEINCYLFTFGEKTLGA